MIATHKVATRGNEMRRSVLFVAVAALILFAWTVPANGHTLTIGKARIATVRFIKHEYQERTRARQCYRYSQHRMDCGYVVVSSDGFAQCGTVTVKFASRRSSRVVVDYTNDEQYVHCPRYDE